MILTTVTSTWSTTIHFQTPQKRIPLKTNHDHQEGDGSDNPTKGVKLRLGIDPVRGGATPSHIVFNCFFLLCLSIARVSVVLIVCSSLLGCHLHLLCPLPSVSCCIYLCAQCDVVVSTAQGAYTTSTLQVIKLMLIEILHLTTDTGSCCIINHRKIINWFNAVDVIVRDISADAV